MHNEGFCPTTLTCEFGNVGAVGSMFQGSSIAGSSNSGQPDSSSGREELLYGARQQGQRVCALSSRDPVRLWPQLNEVQFVSSYHL